MWGHTFARQCVWEAVAGRRGKSGDGACMRGRAHSDGDPAPGFISSSKIAPLALLFPPPSSSQAAAAAAPSVDPSWATCDKAAPTAPATGAPKPGRHDCLCGCVLTGDLVCGANGLTYDSECLASCSGTIVSHKGACVVWITGGAPPPDPHAGKGGSAASTAPLQTLVEGVGPVPTRQYHALAGMLDTAASAGPAFAAPRAEPSSSALAATEGDGSGPAGGRRTVSEAAIRAFEADGFALVGMGRGPGAALPTKAAAATPGRRRPGRRRPRHRRPPAHRALCCQVGPAVRVGGAGRGGRRAGRSRRGRRLARPCPAPL